ncbi:MAG TPA: NAD(P)H-hydrate dehydratase [Alphaproteobacteria bacterium]|nr:NAD(P)H-hydrate dehydratase [Alphaproteobacteria bacterium]
MSEVEVTPGLLAGWPLPPIAFETDKEARGRVMVLGGGGQVVGAAVLAGLATLRAGAGKLQLGAPASVAPGLGLAIPEARVFALPETPGGELAPEAAETIATWLGRCDAAVIGPGMVDEKAAAGLVLRLLDREGPPMVVDCVAMTALARDPAAARLAAGRLVLTPHAGEMAALLDRPKAEVEADPAAAARRLAAALQAVVALKGAVTFIASPDGQVWRHEGGSPGLATSGSGDVLSGVIAGLMGRGAAPAQAAAWGCFVHGACGRRLAQRIAPLGFLARELLDEIAPVIGDLEAGRA